MVVVFLFTLVLISFIRKERKPQELRLPPDDVYASEELKDRTQCLSLRSWVQDWLAFLRWYCILALSEKVSLAEFFNSPVVNTSWVLEGHSERDQSCPFWSPLEVLRLGRGYRLKTILESRPIPSGFLFLGGASGKDYLVPCVCSSFGFT